MAVPPSNGTMGHLWMDCWCFRCVHDHGMSHVSEGDPALGCWLLARMLMADNGTDFAELREEQLPGEGWDPERLECLLFDRCPCEDDGDWQPAPPPDPNQGVLFDMADDSPHTPGGMVLPRTVETVQLSGTVL